MREPGDVVPLRIDLSAMVKRSVATLYSNLVTRPTGQALRLGIETQIREAGTPCLSVLDFRQVLVMDYSCADEAVAKLLLRYLRADSGLDAYFVARGVAERHLETIEAVLGRHGLALVADIDGVGLALLGPLSDLERRAWQAIERARSCDAVVAAEDLEADATEVARALEALAARRLLLRTAAERPTYFALSVFLPSEPPG